MSRASVLIVLLWSLGSCTLEFGTPPPQAPDTADPGADAAETTGDPGPDAAETTADVADDVPLSPEETATPDAVVVVAPPQSLPFEPAMLSAASRLTVAWISESQCLAVRSYANDGTDPTSPWGFDQEDVGCRGPVLSNNGKNLVVAWLSGSDAQGWRVRVTFFGVVGVHLSDVFDPIGRVDSQRPAIPVGGQGASLIVYVELGVDDTPGRVLAQRVDSAGQAVFGEPLALVEPVDPVELLGAARISDGFVALWATGPPEQRSVQARRFDSDGGPIAPGATLITIASPTSTTVARLDTAQFGLVYGNADGITGALVDPGVITESNLLADVPDAAGLSFALRIGGGDVCWSAGGALGATKVSNELAAAAPYGPIGDATRFETEPALAIGFASMVVYASAPDADSPAELRLAPMN